MARQKMETAEASGKLAALDGWTSEDGMQSIRKSFRFADFSEAFAFMVRAAMAAEKLDHHPDWRNVYKTVDVLISTHDAGGLTDLDFQLAAEMDRFASHT